MKLLTSSVSSLTEVVVVSTATLVTSSFFNSLSYLAINTNVHNNIINEMMKYNRIHNKIVLKMQDNFKEHNSKNIQSLSNIVFES